LEPIHWAIFLVELAMLIVAIWFVFRMLAGRPGS